MFARIMIYFLAIPGLIGCLEYSGEHDITVAGLFDRDVCPSHDEATREAMKGISFSLEPRLPMCSLVEPQGAADVCGTDDAAYWRELQQCPVPVHIPWLCTWLGSGAACVVCLRSIQEGSCHRLFTYSVFAVTRAMDSVPSISNQDLPVALRLGILCQAILVVELLVATTSIFFLFLYLIIKLDGQRHIRNRNIRGRLQQLIHHIYIYCGPRLVVGIAMSVYVKMCGWTGQQGQMDIAVQQERMEQMMVAAPCDCDPFAGIKRSHDVNDDQANFEFVYG
ncbi:uncharacterized protein [Haliotis cracherodii]|uniref:uncharacterized protein n=1 Tax=Haliotis cracherodii TaxID=6455 RepID=UPI0039ECEF93